MMASQSLNWSHYIAIFSYAKSSIYWPTWSLHILTRRNDSLMESYVSVFETYPTRTGNVIHCKYCWSFHSCDTWFICTIWEVRTLPGNENIVFLTMMRDDAKNATISYRWTFMMTNILLNLKLFGLNDFDIEQMWYSMIRKTMKLLMMLMMVKICTHMMTLQTLRWPHSRLCFVGSPGTCH